MTDEATGSKAPGVRVTAVRLVQVPDLRVETVTDAYGAYSFLGLRPGPWRAFAQLPGRATKGLADARPSGYDPFVVVVASGATTTLDLVLVAGASATGRVLDADGAPVSGVTVTAIPVAWKDAWNRRLEQTAWERATSGADGSFRLDGLAPGLEVLLEATSLEYLPAAAGPFTPDPAAPISADIHLAPVRFVEVRVVDAGTDEPMAKASVLGWFPKGTSNWKGLDEPWTADEHGHVRAGPLPAGPVKFTATPPGRLLLPDLSAVEVVPPETTSVVVRVKDGLLAGEPYGKHATVESEMRWPVRVTGPDGKAVPRAQISLYTKSGCGGSFISDGLADARLHQTDPGTWIEVFDVRDGDDLPLPMGPVRVRPGAGPPTVLQLPVEETLSGRVVGPDGAAVAGALVVAFPEWWRDALIPPSATGHATTRTDAAGAFRLGRLADTEYELEVRPPPPLAAGKRTSTKAGSTDVVIHLGVSVEATITVVDDVGLPVSDALVTVVPPPASAIQQSLERRPGAVRRTTDAHGASRFDRLDPANPLEVHAEPPVGRPELRRASLLLWRCEDVTLHLARVWEIRGVVRDERGAPVPGASVMLVTSGPTWGFAERVAQADAMGRFSVTRDSTAPVTLRVGAPKGGRSSRDGERVAIPGGPEVVLTQEAAETPEHDSPGR